MDAYNLASTLSRKGLNTVLFSDPFAKLCLTSMLACQGKVLYLDLDTTFSAYLKAGLIRADKGVDVYLPSESNFIDIFKDILSKMEQKRDDLSLVVFDSINSFYTMYYAYYRSGTRTARGSEDDDDKSSTRSNGGVDSSDDQSRRKGRGGGSSGSGGGGGQLNHLLCVLLMLLVRQGVSIGVPVLVTSMLRYRKEGGWKQSPTSRRLLQQKSFTRFEVNRVENELLLKVLQHELIPAGTSLSFEIKALH